MALQFWHLARLRFAAPEASGLFGTEMDFLLVTEKFVLFLLAPGAPLGLIAIPFAFFSSFSYFLDRLMLAFCRHACRRISIRCFFSAFTLAMASRFALDAAFSPLQVLELGHLCLRIHAPLELQLLPLLHKG